MRRSVVNLERINSRNQQAKPTPPVMVGREMHELMRELETQAEVLDCLVSRIKVVEGKLKDAGPVLPLGRPHPR